ncbi:carbohydrate ABC transporter permease [Duganella qianjiadongensis]|uniref:ABC transporter permease subunit n=1 Tax=Duganella qianjiadongensis TaxID=2692176 RepID=A0ABW9VMR2_9BURK|nr:sugar ABC transporter permease [Duganella qianjiadongensis]MYM40894.1 ABC transporter permease subunit [Duganella qianjiadongensis]
MKHAVHTVRPWQLVLFLAPALLIYTLFSAMPLAQTLAQGFFSADENGKAVYAGLENFRTILLDPDWSAGFWNAMVNNARFFAIHMLLQNPIGLALATLFSLKGLRGARTYRTLIFLPTLLSVVIIGFIWQLILSPLWGVGEKLLGYAGLAELFAPWLGQEETALTTLSIVSVWQYIGMPMMLIYAALLAVPDEIIEAAHVEGASAMRIFWQIKLPLIYPTLGLVTILTFVANFNAFDLIYSVKGALAGPNYSTDILGTLFYRTFFGYQAQVGNAYLGSAVATLMFLVILAGVGVYFVAVQRRLTRFAL